MPKITEKEFMHQVIQLSALLGYWCYHTHDSRRSEPGFPDLVIVKPGREVISVELKSETGKTTAEQDRWLERLRAAGARVYLWRPSDMNEIVKILGES